LAKLRRKGGRVRQRWTDDTVGAASVGREVIANFVVHGVVGEGATDGEKGAVERRKERAGATLRSRRGDSGSRDDDEEPD
jgi:hypothetical protein